MRKESQVSPEMGNRYLIQFEGEVKVGNLVEAISELSLNSVSKKDNI